MGIDFSENQVEFCNRWHTAVKNLKFVQGDAENLANVTELEEGTVDYVINVESSHCYGNIDNFFNGVKRLLKKDGLFLFTDFRSSEGMVELENQLKEHFTVVNTENISTNVMHALKLDTDRRLQMIEEKCPKIFIPLIKKFSGVKGSRVYEELEKQTTKYYAFTCKKSE